MQIMTKDRSSKWGKRLAAFRKSKGNLTIDQAAKLLGVAKATWSRWETGDRIPSKAYQYMLKRLEAGTL